MTPVKDIATALSAAFATGNADNVLKAFAAAVADDERGPEEFAVGAGMSADRLKSILDGTTKMELPDLIGLSTALVLEIVARPMSRT